MKIVEHLKRLRMLALLILLAKAQILVGQSRAAAEDGTFRSISTSFGIGKLAIRDGAISDQKYAGPLTLLGVDWNDFNPGRGTHWGIKIQAGEDIANGLVAAEVVQLELNLDMLYSVYRTQIMGKNAFVYLGPSTGVYLYLREQQIAFTGGTAGAAVSIFMETPLGVRSRMIVPLGRKIRLEADLYIDAVSLAIRVPIADDEDVAKLIHLGNSPEANLDVKLNYFIAGGLYFHLATQQKGSKVGAWDSDLLSGYSGISFGLGYDFNNKGNH